ncbi:MAG: DUF899 domain-containing protein [Phycisphaerales bacterium]
MTTNMITHPPVVSRGDWLVARERLLAREKELTRAQDALSAERRRLPMVRIDKPYVFEGPPPRGRATLLDLFEGRRQLIIYHFMFDADDPPPGKSGAPWDEGCPGCSFAADQVPHLAHLYARDTSFALVSRAPLAKITPFKERMGWALPWYSSFGSEFNYDFHVTLDAAKGSVEWNYRSAASLVAAGKIPSTQGELPALSCFLRVGDEVYHTYSAYARGLEPLLTTCHMLDLTAYGRQESWEDSPEGWPRTSLKDGDWVRHHDRYENGYAHGPGAALTPMREASCPKCSGGA